MKYERAESFKRDYRRLSEDHRREFRKVVSEDFVPALELQAEEPGSGWPSNLRVKGVEGAAGIWEMTWSFTDLDGRSTWQWIQIDGQPAIRWRRIGSHAIFKTP